MNLRKAGKKVTVNKKMSRYVPPFKRKLLKAQELKKTSDEDDIFSKKNSLMEHLDGSISRSGLTDDIGFAGEVMQTKRYFFSLFKISFRGKEQILKDENTICLRLLEALARQEKSVFVLFKS